MPENILRAMPKEDWQLLERLVQSLRNGNRPGGGQTTRRQSRTGNPRPRTMAKITAVGEDGQYDAVEVIWDTDAGEWIDLPDGFQWLIEPDPENLRAVGVLTEQGGSAGAAVDDVVEARLGPTVDTGDDSTGYGWFFVARESVWGRITSTGNGSVEWELLDGSGAAHPSGFTGEARSVSGASVSDGDIVRLYPNPGNHWSFEPSASGGATIPVELTVASGGGGDDTTSASFVYEARDLTVAAPGGDIPGQHSPLMARPPAGRQSPASYGLMFLDGDQLWRLIWCDEQWEEVITC